MSDHWPNDYVLSHFEEVEHTPSNVSQLRALLFAAGQEINRLKAELAEALKGKP